MPLDLITGPAGSGKTGEILDRFVASLDREPVLVVPTGADIQRYEEEILFRARVPVGGRVTTFGGLFNLVGRACGVVARPVLSPVQRELVMAGVARSASLTTLQAPARRAGFPAALDHFVGELQSAMVTPEKFSDRMTALSKGPRGLYLAELASLYAGYCDRRAGLGRSDDHVLAAAAIEGLRADPGPWDARPVVIHGFDDLTGEQLALVAALAEAGDVAIAVVHEPGRAALAARQGLVDRLEALGESLGQGFRHRTLPPSEREDPLAHLERGFLSDDPARRAADGQILLMDAAGERAEVELVAAEVAALLRSGQANPDDIALIARSPDVTAGLVERVFEDWGIPVAVHARTPFSSTTAGGALMALVRAVLGRGAASDLIAYLRCPGRASIGSVDDLERRVRQEGLETVQEALELFRAEGGRELWELGALREAAERGGAELLQALARIARDLFEYPLRRTAPVLGGPGAGDRLAAERAATALEEAAALCADDPAIAMDGEAALALLAGLGVPRHSGAVAGRVELMSPYRARARQYPYVFVLSLQEGVFPQLRGDDPFLTEPERQAAGLPSRADQHDEERYLFYACITRPVRRLHLSYRSSDEDGAEQVRSFFVDDVLELLERAAAEPFRVRGLADTVFPADAAPSVRELARSLALRSDLVVPPALGASTAVAALLEGQLAPARARADFLPGSLEVPEVLEELGARHTYGASSLEEYATCPFRYFVGHELRPEELAPAPEAMTRGSLVHEVLERVYRARYEGSLPTLGDVEPALAEARDLLAQLAPSYGLDPSSPRRLAGHRRIESDIVRFIRWDAAHPLGERVFALEAAFGERDDDEQPALQLDGFALHGKIDRIDRLADGSALIRDYKSGASVSNLKDIGERGKLQLQLYLLAAERLWGLPPGGGIYHALGNQHPDTKPRGMLPGPPAAAPFDSGLLSRTDFTESPEDFRKLITAAEGKASEIAGKIQTGVLRRDPIGRSCPRWCDFHTICRMERGEKNPVEDDRERPQSEEASV